MRESGILHAQWRFTASGNVYSRVTTLTGPGGLVRTEPDLSHNEIVLAHGGTGLIDLSLPKSRVSAILNAYAESLGDLIANQFQLNVKAIVRTGGTVDTCRLVVNDQAATPAVVALPDQSIIHIFYMAGR